MVEKDPTNKACHIIVCVADLASYDTDRQNRRR